MKSCSLKINLSPKNDQNPTLTTSNHTQKHGPVCIASFTLAMEHVACKCGASGKLKLYAPFGSL